MRDADTWRGMALWAERKADDAADSDKPRALKNLRLYQNYASRWWGEYYAACRAQGLTPN